MTGAHNIRNSCKTLIGMHGRRHPNQGLATILLAHDPLSSLAYSTITHTSLVAGNFPIKTLVARQQPTNVYTYACAMARGMYLCV